MTCAFPNDRTCAATKAIQPVSSPDTPISMRTVVKCSQNKNVRNSRNTPL